LEGTGRLPSSREPTVGAVTTGLTQAGLRQLRQGRAQLQELGGAGGGIVFWKATSALAPCLCVSHTHTHTYTHTAQEAGPWETICTHVRDPFTLCTRTPSPGRTLPSMRVLGSGTSRLPPASRTHPCLGQVWSTQRGRRWPFPRPQTPGPVRHLSLHPGHGRGRAGSGTAMANI